MLNFPNIKNPIYPLKHKRVDHTYKMEQDNETINTRPRFTKKPLHFTLQWSALPAADYSLLDTFFNDQTYGNALKFQWTYPLEPGCKFAGQTFTVRFSGDLEFDLVNPGLFSGQIALEEA